MKIVVTSNHVYPAGSEGTAASHVVHDEIARGLAEKGHEVTYCVPGSKAKAPEGVQITQNMPIGADIYHINDGPILNVPERNFPWIRTTHCDFRLHNVQLDEGLDNWIWNSKHHADLWSSKRFVHNGLDPRKFIYSATKDDYLLFLFSRLDRAWNKGFDIALSVAKKAGIELRVAANNGSTAEAKALEKSCRENGATFVGSVSGQQKAELFAGAKALLFPSRYNEACPLVMIEALMSGTPVISSNLGSMPELLAPQAGFLCASELEYVSAIENIASIRTSDCRDFAHQRYHYSNMVDNYLLEYQNELINWETFVAAP